MKCVYTVNEDCEIHGNPSEWASLPADKSLFHSPEGCGLPIGNLTSQLFCNVYLNELDQYMKRTLRCRHYGRYVDDFYVVSADREWLRGLIPQVRDFLQRELGLRLHEGKVRISDVRQGVEFLGAYLKPHRRYVSNTTLCRMRSKLPALEAEENPERLRARLNSLLGILGHYHSMNIQRGLFLPLVSPYGVGHFALTRRGLQFHLYTSNSRCFSLNAKMRL